MLEVLLVIEELLNITEAGGNEASDDSSNDSEAKSDAEGSKLGPALLRGRATVLHGTESLLESFAGVERLVSEGGRDGSNNTTEDAWEAVEVVHAAGVVKVDLTAQEATEVKEATC